MLALFVVEDPLWEGAGANRRAFLAATLAALDDALGGRLVVRRGRPEEVVPGVAAEVGAGVVHATGDCTPCGRRRDAAVAGALEADGRRLVRTGSPYAVSPGRVVTGGGVPYRVFTPFRRAWESHGWPGPGRDPGRAAVGHGRPGPGPGRPGGRGGPGVGRTAPRR